MGDLSFPKPIADGHIEIAEAIVTPAVRQGVSFMFNLDPKESANSLAPRVPDLLSDNYRYKQGVGKIEKIGESPYKKTFEEMSFGRRDIA